MTAYLVAMLCIAGPLAIWRRDAIARAATVIIANWVAGYLFNEVAGTFTPWGWSLLIDTIAATIILWRPAGYWQAALGSAYAAQILCHFIYAVPLHPWTPHFYWQVLTSLAFVQLGLLLSWGIYSGLGAANWGLDPAVRANSWRSVPAHQKSTGR